VDPAFLKVHASQSTTTPQGLSKSYVLYLYDRMSHLIDRYHVYCAL